MTGITCDACGAYLEVEFPPGTPFTCGGCGQTLTVPLPTVKPVQPKRVAPPSAPPRATPPQPARPASDRQVINEGAPPPRKVPAKRPAPNPPPRLKPRSAGPTPETTPSPPPLSRTPAASRPGRGSQHAPPSRTPGRRPPRGAYGADASSKNNTPLIIGIVAGAVVIAGIVIAFALSGNDETPKDTQSGTSASAADRKTATESGPSPYAIAYDEARRLGRPDAWRKVATMAREEEAKALRAGDKPGAERYASHLKQAYKEILRHEPGDAQANEALGRVLFDLGLLRSLSTDGGFTDNLMFDIEALLDEAEHDSKLGRELKAKGGKIWMGENDAYAKRMKEILARVETFRKDELARKTDTFYEEALRYGQRIAGELQKTQVDFRLDGIDEPFAVFAHKPYVFLVQRSSQGREDYHAQEWNAVLQQLQRTFYARYGESAGVDPMTTPTPVVILRTAVEYWKYGRRDYKPEDATATQITSAGHFEPWNNRLVCYMSSEDQQRTTLFHEGTHQIVQWAMRDSPPQAKAMQSLWFSEGIADYFGGNAPAVENGETIYVPGKIDEGRVENLGQGVKAKSLFTLADLLAYRRLDYSKDNLDLRKSLKVRNAYAQGWALCYFLQNWAKEKYGDKWADYLKEEFRGNSGRKAFTKVFGDDIEGIEKEYLAMIDELEKARVEGRIVAGEIIKR